MGVGSLFKIHDYRVDPFDDSSEEITITDERHKIPASPNLYGRYCVRLNEIPKYDDPSSITIYDEDEAGDMTEVATAPGDDEYQVDYKYETGWVLFNSADAGHKIKVSYKGMGHVISENIAKAFLPGLVGFPQLGGDGSDGTPDFSSGGTITTVVKEYENMEIPTGETVTCDKEVTVIGVRGICEIVGTLTAVGKGGVGGLGGGGDGRPGAVGGFYNLARRLGGAGAGGGGNHTGGASHGGGAGGNAGAAGGAGGAGGDPGAGVGGNGGVTDADKIAALKPSNIFTYWFGAGGGSGGDEVPNGGNGGNGGGVVFIFCDTLIFSGVITCAGSNGGNGGTSGTNGSGAGGGGGGGCVVIVARKVITNTGTKTVSGGAGGTSTYGGNGGAGAVGQSLVVDLEA